MKPATSTKSEYLEIKVTNEKGEIRYSCDHLPEGYHLTKRGLLTNCMARIQNQPYFGKQGGISNGQS